LISCESTQQIHEFFTADSTEEIPNNHLQVATPVKKCILVKKGVVCSTPVANLGNEPNISENNYMPQTIHDQGLISTKIKHGLRGSASSSSKKVLAKGGSSKSISIVVSQKHIKPNVIKV
jgi:hypothetical protein